MCLIAYHLIPLQPYTLQSLASIFYRQMNWGLERLTCPHWKVSKKQNWEMNPCGQILPCDCLATKVFCLHGIRQTQWASWRLSGPSKWRRMKRRILRRRTKTSEGIVAGVSMVYFRPLKKETAQTESKVWTTLNGKTKLDKFSGVELQILTKALKNFTKQFFNLFSI